MVEQVCIAINRNVEISTRLACQFGIGCTNDTSETNKLRLTQLFENGQTGGYGPQTTYTITVATDTAVHLGRDQQEKGIAYELI